MKRLIVGISGASGAIYGVRLLQVLRDVTDIETHLVMSQAARQTLSLETDFSLREGISRCHARCARYCRQHLFRFFPDAGDGDFTLFNQNPFRHCP